jgi:thiamine biosynthesis lipoprotein
VTIGIGGLERAGAHRVIDAGFAAVAEIHSLMSFHAAASDVSRLNRDAATRPVAVDARTLEVLRAALEFSRVSAGTFDVAVAARLVEWGLLPAPALARLPDRNASWRDIELLDDGRVRFHRPLWIDLGGIAKGFAVDAAFARMALGPEVQVVVDAGGDLRTAGPEGEVVRLAAGPSPDGRLPMLRLQDGSLASSGGPEAIHRQGTRRRSPHVDGRRRRASPLGRFVSVLAPHCVIADALTKIVMARGANAADVLGRYGATALVHDPREGWRRLGAAS